MIEEQYVSFDTAKMAKEKGFETNASRFSRSVYDVDGHLYEGNYIPAPIEILCKATTKPILSRWLMEKRDIFLSPNISAYGFNFEIVKISTLRVLKVTVISRKYEEAFEIALQDALKLI